MFGADATVWVILVAVVVLLLWNTAVTMAEFPGATISESVLYAAQKWPVIPLMAGLLLGHVFWPQYRTPLPPLPIPGVQAAVVPDHGLRPVKSFE